MNNRDYDYYHQRNHSNIFYDVHEPYSYELRMRAWNSFKRTYPFNAQLIIHLYGQSAAPSALIDYKRMSEVKAAALCSYFNDIPEPVTRLG